MQKLTYSHLVEYMGRLQPRNPHWVFPTDQFEGYGRRRRVGSNALICQRFDAPVLWEALLYPLSSHESAFGLQIGSQHIFTTPESKWDQSRPIPVA